MILLEIVQVMAGQGTLALEMCEQLAEIPQLDSKIRLIINV